MARQPKAKPEREIRDIPDMSAENVRRLVHELRTHQIELEAQNEELRRAKDELIEVRDNYASLYDFAPVGYLTVIEKGLIVGANLTLTNMLGVERRLLMNQPLSSFVLPEDQDVYYWHLRARFKTNAQDKDVCQLRMRRSGGDTFWAQLESVLVAAPEGGGDQLRCVISDITERKQAADALQKAHGELEHRVKYRTAELAQANKVLDAINDVFREALRCETEEELGKSCLGVAEELTGSKFGLILELNAAGLIDTLAVSNPEWDTCDIAVADARKAIQNMPVRGIDRATIREGKSRIVNRDEMATHPDRIGMPEGHPEITAFLGVPFKRDGKTVGMIGLGNKKLGYDAVDQESVEALSVAIVEALRYKRATLALLRAQEELVRNEKLAVLGRLTATVSHELRNPLGTIRTAIFSLRERTGGRDKMVDRALTRADNSVLRCDGIIEELLDFTRTPKLNLAPTSIDDWLGEILDEATIPEGIQVDKGLACGARVALDGQRFRRCVINVIGNACQAMARREGQMRLTVETRLDDSRVAIVVKDTGLGIPAEHLEKVFEPLYSTKSFGVGLGLSIVRQIVEEHGGTVNIESHEGEGAVVTLYLPLGQEDEE